jgi:glycerol-3-phosphate dehydrogenase (NAD(P)+)
MVAEGYFAAKSVHEVNKNYGVNISIAEATYRILYEAAVASDELERVSNFLS